MASGVGGYLIQQPHVTNERHSDKPTHDGVIAERMPAANHNTFAGLIFLCNEATKMDCFKYGVFGISAKKRKLVGSRVTKGMRLFLYDVSLRLLYGVYAASSSDAFMLEPDEFGGDYPWQVEKLMDLFNSPSGPVQRPRPYASNSIAPPRFNETFTTKTGGLIQEDEHTEGYIPPGLTCAFAQSDSLPKPDPRYHAIITKNCLHCDHVLHSGHSFLPPDLTCEASEPYRSIWSTHTSTAKNEHICAIVDPYRLCKVERDMWMRSYWHNPLGPVSDLQNIKHNNSREEAEFYPCKPCQYTSTYAVGDAPASIFDVRREGPQKCMCQEVHKFPTNYSLSNPFEEVPASVYIASMLTK